MKLRFLRLLMKCLSKKMAFQDEISDRIGFGGQIPPTTFTQNTSLQRRDEQLGTCGPSLHSSKMAIVTDPKRVFKVK